MPDLYTHLEDRLEVDRYALDDELIAQPKTYLEVAKAVALAISRRDAAKVAIKRVEADADKRIRKRLEASGEKGTEAIVKRETDLDKAVQAAQDEYNRLCLAADEWIALKESWMMRSYALKDLVVLHQSAYSQSPSVTAPTRAAAAESDYNRQRAAQAAARKKKRTVIKEE